MNPLSALKDIHAPSAITLWPPALGWIILAVFIIIAMAALGYYIKKRRQHYRVKAYALKELNDIPAYTTNNNLRTQAYNALLKRVAVHYFPDERTITLSEKDWVNFLISKLPQKHQDFASAQAHDLVHNLYRPAASDTDLTGFVQLWIRECQ